MYHFTTEQLPSGLSSCPFTWLYYTETFDMSFNAGFLGCTQDKHEKTIRPKIGWFITDKMEKKHENTHDTK